MLEGGHSCPPRPDRNVRPPSNQGAPAMTDSPENNLPRCPICGTRGLLELCDPSGVSLCPKCGALLRWFRARLAPSTRLEVAQIRLATSLREALGADSLDVVEIMMELEEEFGV